MIKSKFLFRLPLQAANSLAKKATFVCSLLMNVKDGQVDEPLSLNCGTEPGFQSSSSGKQSFVSCLFAAFFQKKLADRNVCSRLLNLVFVVFIFS